MKRLFTSILFSVLFIGSINTMGLDEPFGMAPATDQKVAIDLDQNDDAIELVAEQDPLARLDELVDYARSMSVMEEPQIEPKLSLYACGICDKESTQRCLNCKGAYYCTTEHQKADWPAHKKVCKIIAQAHIGHIQQIRNFYCASVAATKRFKSKQCFNETIEWQEKFLVRIAQDIDCSSNPACIAFYDKSKFKDVSMLTQLASITGSSAVEQLRYAAREAFNWGLALMENHRLIAPYGIATYIAGDYSQFIDTEQKDDQLISPEQWVKMRGTCLSTYGKNVLKLKVNDGKKARH